jgi:hypothetical protein
MLSGVSMRPEYAWKYIETFIFIGKANFIRAALNFIGIQPEYDKCDCAILTLIIMVACIGTQQHFFIKILL